MKSNVIGNSRNAWSIAEVAERNSVSKQFVRLEIQRGKLKAKRLGRRVVVLSVEEQNWLQQAPQQALAGNGQKPF